MRYISLPLCVLLHLKNKIDVQMSQFKHFQSHSSEMTTLPYTSILFIYIVHTLSHIVVLKMCIYVYLDTID